MQKLFLATMTVGVFAIASLTMPALSKDAELKFALWPLAFLGDAAPNGGEFVFGFEPYAINNRGDVGFGVDLSVEGLDIGQGIFIRNREGDLVEVVRASDPLGHHGYSLIEVHTPIVGKSPETFITRLMCKKRRSAQAANPVSA